MPLPAVHLLAVRLTLHACLCCSNRMVAALLEVHTIYMHELLCAVL